MLQTIEAEYDNGVVHLLEKPKVMKSRALVTFIPDAGKAPPEPSSSNSIDWDSVRRFKGHASKWLGCIKGADASRLRDDKAARILGKHG